MDKIPDTRLSLQWERSSRIRRIAPISRIIDPDSSVPPKKVPISPLYLPSMRTIVRALCPNKLQLTRPVPSPAPVPGPVLQPDHEEGGDGDVVASTSGVRVENLQEQFPMEEITLGDDDKIDDWDWWGSSTSNPVRSVLRLRSEIWCAAVDGEAEDEATVVGSTQPQPSSFTPAPPPITPSRYHPCRSILYLAERRLTRQTQIGLAPHRQRRHSENSNRQPHRSKNSNHQLDMRKARSTKISRRASHVIPRFRLSSALRAPS